MSMKKQTLSPPQLATIGAAGLYFILSMYFLQNINTKHKMFWIGKILKKCHNVKQILLGNTALSVVGIQLQILLNQNFWKQIDCFYFYWIL